MIGETAYLHHQHLNTTQQQQQLHGPGGAVGAAPAPTPVFVGAQAGNAANPTGLPYDQEAYTAVRCSWNVWPPSKADHTQVELPLGILFTPLRDGCDAIPLIPHEPLRSRGPGGCIFNPFCSYDVRTRSWVCPFTLQRNQLPPQYVQALMESPETVLETTSPTVEYVLASHVPTGQGPFFLLLVDTVMYEEELDKLKENLKAFVEKIPDSCRVGLITYGTTVNIFDLSHDRCNKSFVFIGSKEESPTAVKLQLGLNKQQMNPFLAPITECRQNLINLIAEISVDKWPVKADCRQRRCTGTALSLAAALVEASAPKQGGRLMLFTAGVCTYGPGAVAEQQLSHSIRQHHDLIKETKFGRQSKQAQSFYLTVALRAAVAGFCIDIYACALDQCGLFEMRYLTEKTGGLAVLADSFELPVFEKTFHHMLEVDSAGVLRHGYNARLNVVVPQEVKVCGAIGSCVSTTDAAFNAQAAKSNSNRTVTSGSYAPSVSDSEVGEGKTSEWAIGGLDRNSTIALYFEVTAQSSKSLPPSRQTFVQLHTTYRHPATGEMRLRVTTVTYKFASDPMSDVVAGQIPIKTQLAEYLDAESCCALAAKVAVWNAQQEYSNDVLRWIDRRLIRFCSYFADYRPNEASSFSLAGNMQFIPMFFFHLRRSRFLQLFNASPDETAFYRLALLRADTQSISTMVTCALYEYSINHLEAPVEVAMDSESLKPDVILLLDSYFHIIVWQGESIVEWIKQGYHLDPEFNHIKVLIETPRRDAEAILENRMPAPKFLETEAKGSQARYLMAKVNPSSSYSQQLHSYNAEMGVPSVILTDDVSYAVFVSGLANFAVKT